MKNKKNYAEFGCNIIGNDYAKSLGGLYNKISKPVLAAIAVSALTGGGCFLGEARDKLLKEWTALYLSKIVKQKPIKIKQDDEVKE